jgi:hypothetical protein
MAIPWTARDEEILVKMWPSGDVQRMVIELGRGWSAIKEKAKRLDLNNNASGKRVGMSANNKASFYENTYAKMLKKAGKTVPKLGEQDMMRAMSNSIKNRPEYRENFVHKESRHGLDI